MSDRHEQDDNSQEQPLLAHLTELRTRLLHAIACVLVIFLCLAFFSNDIYSMIATPLLAKLPANSTMIATEVASPFLVPFKLTIFVALFISMPYILYQVWAFTAPGLYQNEKHFVLPLLMTSIVLFYMGMSFAFFAVFPLMFGFFAAVTPEGVTIMTDISQYLNFILKLFFAFGIAFEVPIATILLIKTGFATTEALAAKRPYIIVGAFAIGMLLTPPDVISQILLALPIWLLFEIGLYFSRYFVTPEEDQDINETSP
ncbi:MAG: twin-arginine translocase subunit TatC [Gammaproteobacteria bacterium]|nr:twin-arginine translocase subunit TatC [Gammaproteobacteria bacterium]